MPEKPSVWLTGAGGMLGQATLKAFKSKGFEVKATNLDVDITDPAAIKNFAGGLPDRATIVNCAAYTAVDKAESEKETAMTVNGTGPGLLAELAAAKEWPLFHVSTDYIFGSGHKNPIKPDTPPAPESVYAESKLAGERQIMTAGSGYSIVRTAWLFGPGGPNFVQTIIRLLKEREELTIVADQRGAPTYTGDLASFLVQLVLTDNRRSFYHFTNSGTTTWYDFAVAIQNQCLELGLISEKKKIIPITTAEFPTPAKRPDYSVLDCSDSYALGGPAPDWQTALGKYLAIIKDNG